MSARLSRPGVSHRRHDDHAAPLFDDLDGGDESPTLDHDALGFDSVADLDALDESLTTARGALHGALRGLR